MVVPSGARVFVLAGIARPERFLSDITAVGWQIVGTLMFRDHHRFTPRDIRRLAAAAKEAAAAVVLTTEKDAVRLGGCDIDGIPIAAVPLAVGDRAGDAFRDWLLQKLL